MPTYIYHFTHMSNLASIVESEALYCDRICQSTDLNPRNIAYSNLKERRRATQVEIAPGGTLCDYVPFYFGTRSPMLYTYSQGNVTGRRENQDEIIYLVSSAETITSLGLPFVFTDGHPVKEPRAFFDDLSQLQEVDLPLMQRKYWYDTDADPDRMRRRQAEFLVHHKFPWIAVLAVGVRTSEIRAWAVDIIQHSHHQPPCVVRPMWYYSD